MFYKTFIKHIGSFLLVLLVILIINSCQDAKNTIEFKRLIESENGGKNYRFEKIDEEKLKAFFKTDRSQESNLFSFFSSSGEIYLSRGNAEWRDITRASIDGYTLICVDGEFGGLIESYGYDSELGCINTDTHRVPGNMVSRGFVTFDERIFAVTTQYEEYGYKTYFHKLNCIDGVISTEITFSIDGSYGGFVTEANVTYVATDSSLSVIRNETLERTVEFGFDNTCRSIELFENKIYIGYDALIVIYDIETNNFDVCVPID